MPNDVEEIAPHRPGFIQRRWGLCIVLAIINLAIWCYFIAWMFGAWDFWHWQWAVEHGPELASELRQIGRRVFTISAIIASHLGSLPLVFLLHYHFTRKGSV